MMLPWDVKARLESQLSRMNCQQQLRHSHRRRPPLFDIVNQRSLRPSLPEIKWGYRCYTTQRDTIPWAVAARPIAGRYDTIALWLAAPAQDY